MARLAINPTMLDQIKQVQDEDEQSDSWMAQRAHPSLTRDANGFAQIERLVVYARVVSALGYPIADSPGGALFEIHGPHWIREDVSCCLQIVLVAQVEGRCALRGFKMYYPSKGKGRAHETQKDDSAIAAS